MLALLVSDIANPFYPQLARAIERKAALRDYTLVICSTDDNPSESSRHMDRLAAYGIDGIIHASVGEDEATVLGDPPTRVPIVFTNRRPQSTTQHFVVSDNDGGARTLTQYLLDLGHRKIGFVAGPASASPTVERLSGFTKTMAGTVGAQPIIFRGRFDPETGNAAVHAWRAERPTAIIGVNDLVSMGVIEGLLAEGLRVPEDVSVAGFDDAGYASSRLVGLTTVAQDIHQLANVSVEVLFRALESSEPLPRVQRVLPTALHIRRTVAPPAS